ncbi:MurR/RpiR family transcriptional regulator [Spiroplasma monobiae]|uniref:HTH rpiR-type domain-containing protein n=1 Tax=Spiroplasma monobiae MQ-1 TaxID=1336748 RepID=A0A2K9LYB2_SPISQ|nr:MurR/RpiR family transcriptional regulator [Spiroplasma monobiae]AUM62724.1 hypothetical protein SMONO_v1c04750 [Spiroplasma monobiae MQ-1]
MISVFEKLEILSKDFEETTFKIIAKKIMENSKNGKFFNQEELASQTFVSISTLTKFSKKLGFSGYREFIFTIKNEWSKYNYEKTSRIDSQEVFANIQNWIQNNEKFVDEIIIGINRAEVINIYSSYQAYDCSKYFANLLIEYGKDVILLNNEFRFKPRQQNGKGINIVVLTGRDNDTLIDNFTKSYETKENNYLIVTEKQENKLEEEFWAKMLIDFDLDNSRADTRILALNMLFFTIFNKL